MSARWSLVEESEVGAGHALTLQTKRICPEKVVQIGIAAGERLQERLVRPGHQAHPELSRLYSTPRRRGHR
jgi:hypothetical protein